MKISEKIVAAEELLLAKKDAISALIKSAEDEDRDLDDEEQAQIEEHSEAIESTEKNLESLRRAEKALATREASTKDAKDRLRVPARAEKEKPGDLLIKMAAIATIAHQTKASVADVARKMYADDARMDAIVKTIVNPADTLTPGWAAELVGNSIQGFMEELRGDSLYARLAGMGTSIEFGNNGSVSVPGWGGSGTDLAGSFIAEGMPIPVKRSTVISQVLNRYKMAVISTFTKELQRSSTPQIEALVNRKIRGDTAQALDVALLDGADAVAGVRPPSITFGAATQASAGTDVDAILTDLRFLLGVLTTANAGRTPVLMMHPSRVLGLSLLTNATGQFMFRGDISNGTLLNATLVTSTNIDPGLVVIVDASEFATAFGTPEFEVSDVATIVEANDDGVAPEVDTVGAAALAGTPPVRSLFQTWSTGLRMVMPLSWSMMRPGTVGTITGAAW